MIFFRKKKKRALSDFVILYGTKTGNAKTVALQAQKYCEKMGLQPICKSMSGFKTETLEGVKTLLVVVSTHGEGEPPPNATGFFKSCLSDRMGALTHLRYSICALGDASYTHFCWAGQTLDRRFAELGAQVVSPLVRCDLDYADAAIAWIKQSVGAILLADKCSVNAEQAMAEVAIEPRKVYKATLVDRILLTNRGAEHDIYHVVLDISGAHVEYAIGDTVDILPENPPNLVEAVAACLRLLDKTPLLIKELTSVSVITLKKYAALHENGAMEELTASLDRMVNYCSKANVFDLLTNYPLNLPAEQVLAVLPDLTPRKYSISSSQKWRKNRLHLTIKTVRYTFNETTHEGAASVYANEFLSHGGELKFKLSKNPAFVLPLSKNTPLIMVGVSTGIAPFRAILQERQILGLEGNTWLVWGSRSRNSDYLYRDDIEGFVTSGVLERLSLAFSRDSAEKRYVQDQLHAHQMALVDWVRKGAHIYICGSVAMGHSVKKSLTDILANTDVSFDALIAQQRLHEDTY